MKYTLCLLALLIYFFPNAQPSIQWQKTFGGNSYDEAKCITNTTDGGYIIAGSSASSTGDVFGHRGGDDFWIVKLSEAGTIQWKKVLGGTGNDVPDEIQQTSDGGYIVAGWTESNNYDVSGNHGGYYDGWVVKLSSTGIIEWQKALGGSGWDMFWSVQQTSDNGYILAGRTNSTDGDVTENKGLLDYWVVKLTETGSIEWQKVYGGTGNDMGVSVRQTAEGGYIVVGQSASADGDVVGQHGNVDVWVIKLSSSGTLEWQKALGGNNGDIGSGVLPTADGGYVVIGYVGSHNTGDITGHSELGLFDYWVVKLDSQGTLQWQKTAGGAEADYALSIVHADDGGYIVFGGANSTNGDVTDSHGNGDFWLIKVSESGELLWQKSYGGSLYDDGYSIAKTTDNGFILCGFAWSTDGDVSGSNNLGKNDYWIVKLSPETVSATAIPIENLLEIYPNPAQAYATIKVPSAAARLRVTVSDMLGREVSRQAISNGSALDIAKLAAGVYQLAVHTEDGRVFWGKLEKL